MKKKVLIVCHDSGTHICNFLKELSHFNQFEIVFLTSKIDKYYISESSILANDVYFYKFIQPSTNKINIFRKVFNFFTTIINNFFILSAVLKIKKRYNAIEIHFPGFHYSFLLLFQFITKLKIGICFWGDDLFQMPFFFKPVFKILKNRINYFVIGNTSYNQYLLKIIPTASQKIQNIGFGVSLLDKMKTNNDSKEDSKKKLDINVNDIVICCAHNAAKRQNHEVIINEISKLSIDESKNILFLFPIGYPLDKMYQLDLINRINKLHKKVKIITSFIDEETLIDYRNATDVFIHIQESDMFSNAMAEFFYTGAIVVNGHWLEYQDFKNKNGYFISTKKTELHKTIIEIISNLNYHRINSKMNKEIIWELKSWSFNMSKWVLLY